MKHKLFIIIIIIIIIILLIIIIIIIIIIIMLVFEISSSSDMHMTLWYDYRLCPLNWERICGSPAILCGWMEGCECWCGCVYVRAYVSVHVWAWVCMRCMWVGAYAGCWICACVCADVWVCGRKNSWMVIVLVYVNTLLLGAWPPGSYPQTRNSAIIVKDYEAGKWKIGWLKHVSDSNCEKVCMDVLFPWFNQNGQ